MGEDVAVGLACAKGEGDATRRAGGGGDNRKSHKRTPVKSTATAAMLKMVLRDFIIERKVKSSQKRLAVLIEHGGLRVFEEDVRVRVALVEFLRDFLVEIVVGVLALPKTVIEAEDILQRAIGRDALFPLGIVVIEFLDEQQVVRAGVGVDKIYDRDDGSKPRFLLQRGRRYIGRRRSFSPCAAISRFTG